MSVKHKAKRRAVRSRKVRTPRAIVVVEPEVIKVLTQYERVQSEYERQFVRLKKLLAQLWRRVST